jgi:hypothetical protein
MDIITGAAPLFHHSVDYTSHYRSVANRFLVGHVALDGSWEEFALQRLSDIGERTDRYKLKPGAIDTEGSPNPEDASDAIAAALASIQVQAELPGAFDSQTLVCLGASFHDDLHGWDNALFLNWYLAGPPRDFVIAGVGRVTLRPGDVVLFDPSRAHGLVKEGAPHFTKPGWETAAEEHSVFLSADIALTPELDTLFGIERDKDAVFLARGSRDLGQLRVLPSTGAVTASPASAR